MIVIQLSDPHIVAPGELLYGRVDTAEFLARSVAEINRLDPLPDVAVMTGDLVDHGNPAEYEHLRRLLAPLAMPIFVIPGNHDAREPLRAAFAGDDYLPVDGFLQFTIEDYPVRLVALDTLIPGEERTAHHIGVGGVLTIHTGRRIDARRRIVVDLPTRW